MFGYITFKISLLQDVVATTGCSPMVPVATPARSTALVHLPAGTHAPEHGGSQQPPLQAKAQPELPKPEESVKPEEPVPNGMTRRKAIVSFFVLKLAKNSCG